MNSRHQSTQIEYATLRATVLGRVQRVGFRAFVQDAAHRLGLSGYVRNNEDDTVYVEATGRKDDLEKLLMILWRGPTSARVLQVVHEWQTAAAGTEGRFEVRH